MSTCDKLTGTLTLGATMSGGLLVAKGDKGDAYIITESDKQEIKEALSGDINELKGDLSDKVDFSKPQSLTAQQQTQAQSNIGIHKVTQAEYDALTDTNGIYIIVEE